MAPSPDEYDHINVAQEAKYHAEFDLPEHREGLTCLLVIDRGPGKCQLRNTCSNMGEALAVLADQSKGGFHFLSAECWWKGYRQFRVEID